MSIETFKYLIFNCKILIIPSHAEKCKGICNSKCSQSLRNLYPNIHIFIIFILHYKLMKGMNTRICRKLVESRPYEQNSKTIVGPMKYKWRSHSGDPINSNEIALRT